MGVGGKMGSLECWESSGFLSRVLVTRHVVCEDSANLHRYMFILLKSAAKIQEKKSQNVYPRYMSYNHTYVLKTLSALQSKRLYRGKLSFISRRWEGNLGCS